MSFQEECNAILDNEGILEENMIDQLEELVKKRFEGLSQKEIEKKIMDILWKHKDPSRDTNSKVVKVEEIQMEINIEEIEKKIELESQTNKLNDTNADQEYDEILTKIQDLKFQIYGNRNKQVVPKTPIDKISDIFNGAIPKSRIEQSLKVTGYNVVDASRYIINQLKRGRTDETPEDIPKKLFSLSQNIPKAKICTFFARNGQCLRTDCPFSHDLDQKVCHFWLKGNCLAGDNCTFKHSIDEFLSAPNSSELATSQSSATTIISTSPVEKPSRLNSLPSYTPSAAYTPILIQKPLKRPKVLPWEDKSILNFKKYIELRNSAQKNEIQRKKFAEQSTKEWKLNNGGKSKKLSDKANKFEDKLLEDLKLADDELYEYSESTKDEIWFEMHGLEYNEAIDQLSSNLRVARAAKDKLAYLIVPSSTDFQNFKKITKPLEIYLDSEAYRWEIFNFNSIYGSIIVVDPN